MSSLQRRDGPSRLLGRAKAAQSRRIIQRTPMGRARLNAERHWVKFVPYTDRSHWRRSGRTAVIDGNRNGRFGVRNRGKRTFAQRRLPMATVDPQRIFLGPGQKQGCMGASVLRMIQPIIAARFGTPRDVGALLLYAGGRSNADRPLVESGEVVLRSRRLP
jgi:hypothetical protein